MASVVGNCGRLVQRELRVSGIAHFGNASSGLGGREGDVKTFSSMYGAWSGAVGRRVRRTDGERSNEVGSSLCPKGITVVGWQRARLLCWHRVVAPVLQDGSKLDAILYRLKAFAEPARHLQLLLVVCTNTFLPYAAYVPAHDGARCVA